MLIFIFWATFGGKMGDATMCAPNGLEPPSPNPTKKLPAPTGWTSWANYYLEICFRNCRT